MSRKLLCIRCNTVGSPAPKTKGSFLIELLLWICFIVPGLIYSIWRLTTTYQACQSCGSADLVPVTLPSAKAISPDTAAVIQEEIAALK